MFLHRIFSSDERFREVRFKKGMNILVAEKTLESSEGDSRNGTGKSSLVRIVRFVTGGSATDLNIETLADHEFSIEITDKKHDTIKIRRAVGSNMLFVSKSGNEERYSDKEWNRMFGEEYFGISEDIQNPSARQICAQLFRTYFAQPVKTFEQEASWKAGVRFGYMMGMNPHQLAKAGEVATLHGQRRAIRKAIKEGALKFIPTDDAQLRTDLAIAKRKRDELAKKVSCYKVDKMYEVHQIEADKITRKIHALNNELVSLEQRHSELRSAIDDDLFSVPTEDLTNQLERVYRDVGVLLPDNLIRQYEDVASFHLSVTRNRKLFLEDELHLVVQRQSKLEKERAALDERRSQIFQLLESTVAFDTFAKAQESLAELSSRVEILERKVEAATEINEIDNLYTSKKNEAVSSTQFELKEKEERLGNSIAFFTSLGEEIYSDRMPTLTVSTAKNGALKVKPRIPGDSSTGILGVETFLFDIICLVSAIELGRSPRILIHDSNLFDAIDERQISSCLNIGARLAEEYGFQYVVTMNSDRLSQADASGFDSERYIIEPRLTDATEDGGLFGFRFD